jgi:hypothetical protein
VGGWEHLVGFVVYCWDFLGERTSSFSADVQVLRVDSKREVAYAGQYSMNSYSCPLRLGIETWKRRPRRKPEFCKLPFLESSSYSPQCKACVLHHRQGRKSTYPFSRLEIKSLCGPSGKKLVTLNQLVFWLSLGPLFVPTAYLKISCPVLVACSSGVSANRPMIVIFANEDLPVEVEKARALIGRARRRRKEDILEYCSEGFESFWKVG